MLVTLLLQALNARKSRALRLAEASMPQSQFRAFRGVFLDEFGGNGYEGELARIVAEHEKAMDILSERYKAKAS